MNEYPFAPSYKIPWQNSLKMTVQVEWIQFNSTDTLIWNIKLCSNRLLCIVESFFEFPRLKRQQQPHQVDWLRAPNDFGDRILALILLWPNDVAFHLHSQYCRLDRPKTLDWKTELKKKTNEFRKFKVLNPIYHSPPMNWMISLIQYHWPCHY